MAIEINNLVLPADRLLVLKETDTTGTIVRKSANCRKFVIPPANPKLPIEEYDHVLFVKEMASEVDIDGVEYFAMGTEAIVGLIP